MPYTTPSSQKLHLPLVLPPPVNTMVPLTHKDWDNVESAFKLQHQQVSEAKDMLMGADGTREHKVALDNLHSPLVSARA